MRPFFSIVKSKGVVTAAELKRLLVELYNRRPDVGFRYRIVGEMWVQNFKRIVHVNDFGVLLKDEVNNRLTAISSLTHIMQFEIDQPYQEFQPYFHYEVSPIPG